MIKHVKEADKNISLRDRGSFMTGTMFSTCF